jgi:hypothetical protein
MTDATNEAKDKFVRKLKGELVGRDAVDNDLFVGDIILYATTVGQSAELKAGRITKVSNTERGGLKVQVRTVVKGYNGKWSVGGLGTLSKCKYNAVLWKDPAPEIIEMLDAAETKGA